jgi:hypothetical protein
VDASGAAGCAVAQCFEGKALVNFICRDLGIRTRPEAIAAAQVTNLLVTVSVVDV